MKNKYEDIKIVDFCDEDGLIAEILHKVDKLDDYGTVEVYAKSELISYIFTTLLSMDFQIGVVDFDALSCSYCGEYTLTITEDKEIWVTPSYFMTDGNWKPFNSCATYAYLYMEDVDQALIDCLLDGKSDVALFGFEVEDVENLAHANSFAITVDVDIENKDELDAVSKTLNQIKESIVEIKQLLSPV